MNASSVLGYHCSHEQHAPRDLLQYAKLAAGQALLRANRRGVGTDRLGSVAAVRAARHAARGPASPAAFDAAVEHVSPSDVLEKVRASADVGRQLAWLQEDLALGVERIYLHNVAPGHQEHFINACGTRLLPELARG